MKKVIRLSKIIAALGVVCLTGLPQESSGDARKKAASFNKDVAPILFNKCAECHRPGESAPMSLLSYKEARPWARSIKEKVLARAMPPWHADPNHGEFANDRRLTKQEIDTIVSWVDGGAREGSPRDLPPAPSRSEQWNMGKPDAVLTVPEEVVLQAQGTDEYHYIEIPFPSQTDVYVQAAELRPSNRKVAHHITAFIIPPPPGGMQMANMSKEMMEKIRAEMEKGSIFYYDGNLSRTKPDAPVHDDGCSLPSGGSATSWDGSGKNWTSIATPLIVYSPGVNPVTFPPGTARKIPAGSKIFLQAHYFKPEGRVERDRPQLALTFAKTPPDREVHNELLINNYFKIPPGAERHEVTACWKVDKDIRLISFMPHMHWRGRSMRLEAALPDGRTKILLSVPDYNFSWQTTYYLKRPVPIPKGSRLKVVSYFDNSAKNRRNPDPAKAIRAGEPTADEMMACFIDYTLDEGSPKDPVVEGRKK
ncbi:MAG TPA: cytochrome c [Blastocatellia bacterium]|nr:cytochrome c [Blastocatellia bacterium]